MIAIGFDSTILNGYMYICENKGKSDDCVKGHRVFVLGVVLNRRRFMAQ